MLKTGRYTLLFLGLLALTACSKNNGSTNFHSNLNGTGSFTYNKYEPFAEKPIQVFYHAPESISASTPICFVFHGNGRDALETRDALVEKSENLDFIVVVPEFSSQYFPGGDGYNLANIFEDGDHPSASTLNPENEWTFSVIDSLFIYVKSLTSNAHSSYDVVGHSAGAQVAHRFLLFKPNSPINRVVISAAGWYNMPDASVDFPYGIAESPMENSSLTHFFSTPLTVIVGELDNDPNAASLRRNQQADVQGTNRLARAQYFFTQSQQIATNLQESFKWKYRTIPNTAHDMEVGVQTAAEILYR